MHANMNCNRPKTQSFGAIHSKDVVNEIIKKRIKNPNKFKKLDQIVDKAKNNKVVNVTLLANPDGKSICANIYSTSNTTNFFKLLSENFFTKNFGGGIVGFIEKCSNIADKAAIKVQKNVDMANSDVFNKMK